MITMKDFFETVEYRITEGSEYTWSCYGNNAYILSSWNGDNDMGWSADLIFDTSTQAIYEMSVCDYKNSRAYRLINPEYVSQHMTEAKNRDVRFNQAWDDVNYIDLETSEDMLDKTSSIISGVEYDTRVSMPIDLPEDVMFELMKQAHQADMTFNEFMCDLLMKEIKRHENSN